MSTTDLLLIATAAVLPLLMLGEWRWPARRQPHIEGWPVIGIGFFMLYAVVSVLLPLQLPASWFDASLLPGADLGVAGGPPNRLDATGAFVFHPSEMAVYTALGIVINVLLLGLNPAAAAVVCWLGVFNTMFQHANLRTPRAQAWAIQRPEAHSIHHAYGVHGWNYSDFPLWDPLFGTYRAAAGSGRCGVQPNHPLT